MDKTSNLDLYYREQRSPLHPLQAFLNLFVSIFISCCFKLSGKAAPIFLTSFQLSFLCLCRKQGNRGMLKKKEGEGFLDKTSRIDSKRDVVCGKKRTSGSGGNSLRKMMIQASHISSHIYFSSRRVEFSQ